MLVPFQILTIYHRTGDVAPASDIKIYSFTKMYTFRTVSTDFDKIQYTHTACVMYFYFTDWSLVKIDFYRNSILGSQKKPTELATIELFKNR